MKILALAIICVVWFIVGYKSRDKELESYYQINKRDREICNNRTNRLESENNILKRINQERESRCQVCKTGIEAIVEENKKLRKKA